MAICCCKTHVVTEESDKTCRRAAGGLRRSCTSSCCRCRWVALQAQDTVHVPATSCLVLLNEELRETPEAARQSCSLFGPMPHVSASTLLCRLCFLHVRGGSSSMLMHNVHRLTNTPVLRMVAVTPTPEYSVSPSSDLIRKWRLWHCWYCRLT